MAKTYLISIEAAMFGAVIAKLYRVISPHDSDFDPRPVPANAILRGVDAQLLGDTNGGMFAFVRGTPSVPVAMTLASHLIRRFGVVAVYNKECEGYVVVASDHEDYHIGDVIPETEVSD